MARQRTATGRGGGESNRMKAITSASRLVTRNRFTINESTSSNRRSSYFTRCARYFVLEHNFRRMFSFASTGLGR